MTYGLSTRAVSAPIASGQRGRMSQPTQFLPLSQFFLQQSSPDKDDGKVLYGISKGQKKKPAKDAGKEAKPQENPKEPKEEPKKDGAKDEAMTTTANVPTVPVPIGAGDGRKFLDRPGDDKKKKKKKMADKITVLLRRLF